MDSEYYVISTSSQSQKLKVKKSSVRTVNSLLGRLGSLKWRQSLVSIWLMTISGS